MVINYKSVYSPTSLTQEELNTLGNDEYTLMDIVNLGVGSHYVFAILPVGGGDLPT